MKNVAVYLIIMTAYHEPNDGDGGEHSGVPVVRQELLQRGDRLVRQEDLAQGGQRSRRVNLTRIK